jgi:hypothetical protein
MDRHFRCPKWIIEPDEITTTPTPEFRSKYFTCSCDILDCGWDKERIGKIRRRIADVIFKMPWIQIVSMAKEMGINTDEGR